MNGVDCAAAVLDGSGVILDQNAAFSETFPNASGDEFFLQRASETFISKLLSTAEGQASSLKIRGALNSLEGVKKFDLQAERLALGGEKNQAAFLVRIHPIAEGEIQPQEEASTGEVLGVFPFTFFLETSEFKVSDNLAAYLRIEGDWNFLQAVYHEDQQKLHCALRELVDGESQNVSVEVRVLDSEGHQIWISCEGRASVSPNGTPICQGYLSDISHLVEAERQLEIAVEESLFAKREAKEAQAEAQRFLSVLRIASESSGVVSWISDNSLGLAETVGNLGQILGFENRPFKTLKEIAGGTHREDQGKIALAFRDLEAGQLDSINMDFRMIQADGKLRWIAARLCAMPNAEASEPPIVSGIFADIHDRKSQEKRISNALSEASAARLESQRKEEMLRNAANCGGMGVWWIDLENGSAWMQDEGFCQLGYEPGAFAPDFTGWLSIMHPDDKGPAIRAMNNLMRGQTTTFEQEMRFRHKNGEYHWYRSVGQRARNEGEDNRNILAGAHSCIDEFKQIEADLAEAASAARTASRRLAKLADNAPSALFELRIDADGQLTFPYFSRKLPAKMAVPGDQLRTNGSSFFTNIQKADVVQIRDHFAKSAHELESFETKFRVSHAEGIRTCLLTTQPVRMEDGETVWFGNVLDISDIEDAERRAQEAAEAMRATHVRLNTLTDNAPGALFEFFRTSEGRYQLPYYSGRLPEIMGVPSEEPIDDVVKLMVNIPEQDQQGILDWIERSAVTQEPSTFRHRLMHPELGQRWIMSSMHPGTITEEGILWYCGVLDITDLVEAEQRAVEATDDARRAHERLSTITANSPAALFELYMPDDQSLKFNYFNEKLPDLLGMSADVLRKDGIEGLGNTPDYEIEGLLETLKEAADAGETVETKFSQVHPDRGLCWIWITASPVKQPDGSCVWFGNGVDITERLATEYRATEAAQEVQQAHDRLRTIADVAPAGLFELRKFEEGDMSFPYTSARFDSLVGAVRNETENFADLVVSRIHPEDSTSFQQSLKVSMQAMSPWHLRFRLNHPDRGEIWLSGSASPRKAMGDSVTWVGAVHEVTADVRREAELREAHQAAERMRAENERQALHDGLTGLPNRRYYDAMMAERLDGSHANEGDDCVLIRIDLDHFKYVNDTLGHEAGDQVLIRVAEVLNDELRGADFASRIGGDEFSIILAPGVAREAVQPVVERIRKRLCEPMEYEGRQCRFGASFGVVHTENVIELGAEIQLFADAALYRAKEGGRNRIEFFTPELHEDILSDRRLATELQDGLANDEFVPFFQPQVDAKTGAIVGAETLLRWNHPREGILGPDAFMHVAEQLRIVAEIDRIMMEKAGFALERWRQQGLTLPKISFNVSSGRIHDPNVITMAREMVGGPTKVTFELLESILVEDESSAFKYHLDLIREAGIELEIDDFGSGHASIIGVMEIAPNALKIDRRIVAPVAQDERCSKMVRAIVEIAETLGIGIVAEGVETEEQARILRKLGCGVLQGFLYARPLSEADFIAYALDNLSQSA